MQLIFSLLQQMAIIVVIAYLISKSPAIRLLTEKTLSRRDKFVLYAVFSLFSILGTYTGLPVKGAIANTRAIGAVLAGLLGGPWLGTAVGLTAGTHRYLLGGFTAFSCGLSTTVEGLLGGLAHLYLCRRHKPEQVYNPLIALGVTFLAELLQMLIILAVSRPYADAVSLVEAIALPMICANSVGAALFLSMVRDQKKMHDKLGARFSAKALNIADQTLGILSRGFNAETAREMAEIIHRETAVGAVAITDREKVLAFIGIGSDHHRTGQPVRSPLTLDAINQRKVVFADGFKTGFRCPVDENCPLGSALVVPLHVDQEVVGTIKLYDVKAKLFHNINRSFGEGLATLFSHQILRSRYEEQKNLLVRSELNLIQAQVNPHFLFNTLNTIMAVVRKDPDRARNLLLQLSNFFRTNLKRTGDVATLQEELSHSASYLEIEKARFGDRLQVEMKIDPALRKLRVPVFTLQPLLENAIKHGISELLENGRIIVSASRENGLAIIAVEDNAGNYLDKSDRQGLGMSLVDKRIKNLYGSSFGIAVECIPVQRTRVMIRLPFNGGGCG